ncbi:uncharacterized protein ACA1_335890 [Acanthamoeba castellanii str. Neff]|uniref:Exostosin GT47 domain-containing protein n=1 Tax=Acanthamoeba castellanii (strain ATCC 30010 / Neff) TaxID=1257118 RepID=L8H3Y4_ACACF|nr:uncharacterized protein ACA1_335890 [Acanthamoeba castellanii str. Neff]ELR19126.1 hypothetical protein ACA1_335890 [Acanthamoeba castellanii str. Neff]
MKIMWFEDWRLFYTDCDPNMGTGYCTMQSCFDFSRCPTDRTKFSFSIDPLRSQSLKEIEDSDQYAALKQAMVRHPWYTPDPSQACVLFPEVDTLCVISACGGDKFEFKGEMGPWTVADQLAKLTHWNGGRNHLVLEIHDSERMRYDIGKAMGVKSGFAAERYRLGFDISFPLYAQAPVNETAIELSNRRGGFARRPSKYLLTFKGGNNRRHRLRPKVRAGLDDSSRGDSGDYHDLMLNTKFALIVQGNGLHSYRLTEAMRANAVPVILADNYVLPFSEAVRWDEIAIFVPESQWASIPDVIGRIDDEALARMREKLATVYEAHFASMARMVDTVLHITRDRIYAHGFTGR